MTALSYQHTPSTAITFGRGFVINNPEKLTLHRFRRVFHQV
jgi:hypothetical protein